jgi:probable rRNA maturation factor
MPSQHLGDIVICPRLIQNEAKEQEKSERAHWAHLVVHGTLHLRGFTHETEDDSKNMEKEEIKVLEKLGFPNPYLIG